MWICDGAEGNEEEGAPRAGGFRGPSPEGLADRPLVEEIQMKTKNRRNGGLRVAAAGDGLKCFPKDQRQAAGDLACLPAFAEN